MSFKLQDDSQPIDAKNALLNLTKILPVTEAHTLITKICPFLL